MAIIPIIKAQDDILLSEARDRIEAALFAGVPNTGMYTSPEKLQLLMKQLKIPAANYEEAAQFLITKKEFDNVGDQKALRELRHLFLDGNRERGRSGRRGQSYGFKREIYVSARVADGLIAYTARRIGEISLEALSFPEPTPVPELPTPKTMRTYLQQNGDANMDAFMDVLGLDAPPMKQDRLLYIIYTALHEAKFLTKHGRGSLSKAGHDALVVKMQAAHTDITEPNQIEKLVERVEAGIDAMKFTRQEATASLDPRLLAIGEDEIRMLAEVLREQAPKLVAGMKRTVQIGDSQWQAYEQAASKREAGVIYLRKIGADNGEILRTQVPFSDDNIALLFQGYAEELLALRAAGDATVTDRAAQSKFKAATTVVEGQFITR